MDRLICGASSAETLLRGAGIGGGGLIGVGRGDCFSGLERGDVFAGVGREDGFTGVGRGGRLDAVRVKCTEDKLLG